MPLTAVTVPLVWPSSSSLMGQQELFGVPWPDVNEGVLYTDVVKYSPSAAEETLLDYYASRYKDSASTEGWLQRIRSGQIKVNGQVTTSPAKRLSTNATILYHRLPWSEPSAPYEIPILYEDPHLIAVNKPSGLQVLPGGLFQQRTVLQQLKWRFAALQNLVQGSSATEVLQPSPVHRLGRGTSGVLLCAKTAVAKSRLAADFAGCTNLCTEQISNVNTKTGRILSKTYRALVKGIMEHDTRVIDQPIGRIKYPGVSGGLYMACPTGKPSQSKVAVLLRNEADNTTLVEVEIFSGRPHQIRIHMASIGHPLVGDPLYVEGGRPSSEFGSAPGSVENGRGLAGDGGYEKPASPVPGDCGYSLHALRMSFLHPVDKQELSIYAPPPPKLHTPCCQEQIATYLQEKVASVH